MRTNSARWSGHLVLYVLGKLTLCVQYATSECSKVSIKNTMWQSVREGSYTHTDYSCNGKDVYQQSGGTNYLYYIEASGGWRGWMVGTVRCVNAGGIAVQDQSDQPQDVDNTWEEVYGGSWYYSQSLTVDCYRLSGAAIAGIVVGCLIAVGIIITIIVCCCCCKNKKNTNTIQVERAPNISHTNASVHYNGQRAFIQPSPPGHYTGPPAYGSPMVHGYGPPPAYSNYPPNRDPPSNSQPQSSSSGAPETRVPSVPPGYELHDPSYRGDPYGYPTKITN